MSIAKAQTFMPKYVKHLCFAIFTIVLLSSQNSFAAFDVIYFSANGDTTATSMTQGDEIGFGSNCDLGATILWEVWFDYNSNSTIDPLTDGLVMAEHFTDGNLYSEGESTPDGSIFLGPFIFAPPPGSMIFRATDLATESSLQIIVTVNSMVSPPNQFTGQISLPGITPPNTFLQNRPIVAESETGDEGTFIGLTDNNGNYSINIGASGTGVEFYLESADFEGFVSPGYLSATASGVVGNNNFIYSTAVDSVYGFVKDAGGVNIPFPTDISADNNNSDKYTSTKNGRYVIYFSNADKGDWHLRQDSRNLPVHLNPVGIDFSHDTLSSFQHDFTLIEPNAFITVGVNENGGNPDNIYLINAYSELLGVSSEAVTDTGFNNEVQIPVSSLDPSGWIIQIATWDSDYPIPNGMAIENNYYDNIAPGASVNFNLVNGFSVSGTITQDPGDSPINWDNVNVGSGAGSTNVNPDGTYEFFTTNGFQTIFAYANGYLTTPQYITVNVVSNSTGNDFVINKAHSTVSGTLNNVSLPLDASFYSVIAYTDNSGVDGYYVYGAVDSVTGTYTMDLCDGDWTISPPWFFGVDSPTPPSDTTITIGESPSDFTKTIDFTYTSTECCIGLRGNVDNDPTDFIDISDLVYLVDFMFIFGPEPECYDEANITGANDPIDIAELVYLVDFMFLDGPDPAPCP